MALTLLFPTSSRAKIGSLILDASLQETHKLQAKVTSFPVEDGSTISDHILIEPKMVSIEGFVTDSPVRYLTGVRDLLSIISGSGSPSKTAFEKLNEIYENKTVITLVTGLKTYENMVLESLSIPRNAGTGQTLRFNANLKEVRLTTFQETELVADKLKDVNGSKDQATPKQDTGKQQTIAPTTSEKTILLNLYNKAKSVGIL